MEEKHIFVDRNETVKQFNISQVAADPAEFGDLERERLRDVFDQFRTDISVFMIIEILKLSDPEAKT